jgi:hypothetical protein
VYFYLKNENNVLSFPEIPDNLTEPEMYDDTLVHINHIMRDYSNYVSDITPLGYIYASSPYKKSITTIYMFYNIETKNHESDSLSTESSIWPVVFWEIFHTGRVLSKVIDVEIPVVFRSHLDIKPFPSSNESDEEDPLSSLMYPMVGYSIHPKANLDFTAMFGASRTTDGPFGSYFYYYKDVDLSSVSPGIDYTKLHGCVRYVIFAKAVVYDVYDIEFGNHKDVIADICNYIVTNRAESANPITHHLIKTR